MLYIYIQCLYTCMYVHFIQDKMMCCDICDRGYHSFCVDLREIPSG